MNRCSVHNDPESASSLPDGRPMRLNAVGWPREQALNWERVGELPGMYRAVSFGRASGEMLTVVSNLSYLNK